MVFIDKIIFDISTGYSFAVYRGKGKLVSRKGILSWLSTRHTKDELKKIYPNTSIELLNSPQLGNFEKKLIDDLIKDTTWLISDTYKIGIFESLSLFQSSSYSSNEFYAAVDSGKHYFFDWKSEDCQLNLVYQPLTRKNLFPRSLPLTLDKWREIQLDQIL